MTDVGLVAKNQRAAVDVAAHIVADDRLGDVASNHALFDLIAIRAKISG
jgi:hypothetical protein